ncbi:Sec34-like family-domain-containing protein [Limtongia smithiae]|uniref:Sec34-like family-domain-containing protein n=1 Tax=Limtongia smithiae TaxID=1125753 RepID=UPI0034CE3F8A
MSSMARLKQNKLGPIVSDHGAKAESMLYPFTNADRRQILRWDDSELAYAELYEALEKDIEEADDREYMKLRDTTKSHLESCMQFLSQAAHTLELLDTLDSGFDSVKRQTMTFQEACDAISSEQTRLEKLADDIETNLRPFNLLEEFTRRLNTPGTDFVTQDGYKKMLEALDQCILYTEQHPTFMGVEIYQMRFRQCMTRALTLIRAYFMNSIRDVVNDVQSHISAKALNDTTQPALLYTKFRVDAPLLRDLTSEIHQRCEGHEEYVSLLGDCYKFYTNARRKLISPIVSKRIADMRNTMPDLLQLARQSIVYMRTICYDEYDLFYSLFSEGDDVIYNLLESLTEPLQDVLRTRIIHEKKAEVLYELCSLLQGLAMHDNEDDEDEDQEGYFDRVQLDFGRLFQSTLQDAQVKLVFRMQAYS